jgi:acetyltransferase-like isoleucine patch superfamily enzyme
MFNRLTPDYKITYLLLYFKVWRKIFLKYFFYSIDKSSDIRFGCHIINSQRIYIGRNVVIRPGVKLFGSDPSTPNLHIKINDDVLIGSDVHIYTNNHNFYDKDRSIFVQGHQDVEPVMIEFGSWIGAKAVILPGVTIGRGAVVGAGAIVTKDVPPFTVVAGNPARIVKEL